MSKRSKGRKLSPETREKMSKTKSGILLTKKHRKKIGRGVRKYLKNNPRKKKAESPIKKLMRALRKTPEYKKWKHKILKRDVVSYPKIPKFIQVHHLENFSALLERHGIKTVLQARKCKKLWSSKVRGATLTRGEHFLITRMKLHKHISRGFIAALEVEVIRMGESSYRIGEPKKRKRKKK